MTKNKNINKLISLRVKNVFSFLDETKISFLKKTTKNHERGFFTFSDNKDKLKISNINGVYGANSSGKSNLTLNTIAILKALINFKDAKNIIPLISFFKSEDKESIISLEFLTSSQIYNFEIRLKNNQIIYEKLDFKKGILSTYKNIYKKVNKKFYLNNKFEEKIELSDETIISNLTLFNILLHNKKISKEKQKWYKDHIVNARNLILNKIQLLGPELIGLEKVFTILGKDKVIKNQFNKISKEVRLGFDNIKCELKNVAANFNRNWQNKNGFENKLIKNEFSQKPIINFIRLSHETGDYETIKNFSKTLSNGTKQFIETIILLLDAMKNNYILLWDEFACFLDDELINSIFVVIENHNSVQLIFNSNKKTIIDRLDWDQVLITTLNRYLESSVITLNAKMQQAGIERKYRNNYFGNLNDANPINIMKSLEPEVYE